MGRTSDALRGKLARAFEIGDHSLTLTSREALPGAAVRAERLAFRTAEGEVVGALMTRPPGGGRSPAVLYIHAHGNRYEIGASELIDGRPALQGPLGSVLADMGYATLAIDLPGFGTRARQSESALAKARLWRGRSLAGQMLGELSSALDWMSSEPDIDPARIGAFGISMGSTLGYWLAAVDPRIACLAQLCCYADFDALLETGAHDLHGIYLVVPGLLDIASNGTIAGLVAPRPQLIGIGDLDPLTPPAAVDSALAATRDAYARADAGDRLVVHREAGLGHSESPAMRQAVLRFLGAYLG